MEEIKFVETNNNAGSIKKIGLIEIIERIIFLYKTENIESIEIKYKK